MQRPSRGTPPDSLAPSDVHPVLRRSSTPTEVLDLLARAQSVLDEAALLEEPNERYATAHLAALRTAAAVLTARRPTAGGPGRRRGGAGSRGGRPRRSRGPAIRSAWEELSEVAPELTGWSALFAAGAARRARAQAGIPDAAGREDADELIRAADVFLRLAERMLVDQPALPQPRVAPVDEPRAAPRDEKQVTAVSAAAERSRRAGYRPGTHGSRRQ